MSNCPKSLPSDIKEKLEDKFSNNYNELINGIEENLTKDCLRQNGGKKKRKSKNRKTKKKYQKGGNRITAERFTYIANAIFMLILAYMLLPNSAAMKTIITGLSSLFNGECGGSNLIWERIGLGNPVCTSYNNVIRLLLNSIAGDPTSIATLGALTTITLKSPYLMMDALKVIRYQMAKTLPKQLMASDQLELLRQKAFDAVPQMQDTTSPEQQRLIKDIIPEQPESQSNKDMNNETMDAASALLGLKSSTRWKKKKRPEK